MVADVRSRPVGNPLLSCAKGDAKMRLSLVGLLVVALALVGCSRESSKGGPGAKAAKGTGTTTTTTTAPSTTPPSTTTTRTETTPPAPTGTTKTETTTTKTDTTAAKNDTFSIKVPSGATNIMQGKNQEVTVSVNRGSAFKQNVKLSFKAPEGVKITPPDAAVKSGDNDVKVLVQVGDAVPVGKHTITVTGTPDTGLPWRRRCCRCRR